MPARSDTFDEGHSRSAGGCVWLTGLSGAGKSTTAAALHSYLVSAGHASELLDGDALRAAMVPPLGFSRADRETNVRRAAVMACAIADRGVIAVCALISPYRDARAAAREIVGTQRFVEVFVDTPLDVCEARDPKGVYGKARRGEVQNVTGLDDPYEPPLAPEIILRTENCTPADNMRIVIAFLVRRGLIPAAASSHR